MYILFYPVSWGCYHNHPSTLTNACTKVLERWSGKQMARDATTPALEEKQTNKRNCRWRGQHWDGLASWGCSCLGAHAKDCALRTKEKLLSGSWGWWPRLWFVFWGCLLFSILLQGEETMSHQFMAVGSCTAYNGRETRRGTRVKYVLPLDSFPPLHA